MHKQTGALTQVRLMTMNLSMVCYKDDNRNEGKDPIVECNSGLLHDKVASHNL